MNADRPLRLFEGFARLLSGLAGVALVLMMLHVVADVIMKFVFNLPIPGTLEVVAFYYMVAAVFLPLAYVELKGAHITVDLVFDRMPRVLQRVALALGFACSAGFFSILAYQTWLDAVEAYEVGEIVMGAVALPIWPSRFVLPLGFAIIALASIIRLIREVVLGRPMPGGDEGSAVQEVSHG